MLAEVGEARAGDGRPGDVGERDRGAHLVADPALDVGAAGGGDLEREPPLVAGRGVLEELLPVSGAQVEVDGARGGGRDGQAAPARPGEHLHPAVLPADAGAEHGPERLRRGGPGPHLRAASQRTLERCLARQSRPAARAARRVTLEVPALHLVELAVQVRIDERVEFWAGHGRPRGARANV